MENPKLAKWKRLSDVTFGGSYIRPRLGPSVAPCELLDYLCPMPATLNGTNNFAEAMDSVVSRLIQSFRSNTREICICWSGGIDSTSILTGFLKHATADILRRISVVCNQSSIDENPYFYYKFIEGQIKTKDPSEVVLTDQNVNDYYIIDGEGGNQCFGSYWAATLRNLHRVDDLLIPWKSVDDFTKYMPTVKPELVEDWVNMVKSTIPYSPVSIDTLNDFFWWANFNTKFEEVLFRKLIVYTKDLTAENSKFAATTTVIRPFAEHELQVWSLLAKDIRNNTLSVTPKMQAKEYIYNYDKNHHYFYNKLEQASLWYPASWQHELAMIPIFAIDKNWNKYHLSNPKSRIMLGEFLKGLSW